MKSAMGELTDTTNRADAFALMPVVWAFGATMGYVPKLPKAVHMTFGSLTFAQTSDGRDVSETK